MLKDIHSLLKSGNLTNETITKIIILGYNLVELSKKKISLNEKLLAVLNLNEKLDSKKLNTLLNNYTKNNKPLSMLFILGFILGDGNFLIRIRDTGKGL
jgi:GTP:adenosylcobinamide-phosphate guanylyltransferase